MVVPAKKITRLDYGQFLLSSQVNYTLTYFADHARKGSHDTIKRFLENDRITPKLVFDNVKDQLITSENAYIVFDDTVLDKGHSHYIELVRRQWSGNEKAVIKGIGVVTCVYVNPELDQFWVIDYRIYAPQDDGKTKLDHVEEMLRNIVHQKRLPFYAVLMDAWYATMAIMKQIERYDKVYYCPLKANRQVCQSPDQGYERLDSLAWSDQEQARGKSLHIKKFPKGHMVTCFRLVLSSKRTDYIVTNAVDQSSTEATQEVCGFRWKIEQLHREVKQVTGIERCQCRKARMQRNHIGCAFLVWVRLKALADELGQTVYALKQGLLSDYMVAQLRNPTLKMSLAA